MVRRAAFESLSSDVQCDGPGRENALLHRRRVQHTPRTSGKGKNAITLPHYNAQEVFEKYAVEVMGIPKAAPEAAQKMYEHRDFLLSSMTAGKEGLAWGKNPLYTHLCRKFPEDLGRDTKEAGWTCACACQGNGECDSGSAASAEARQTRVTGHREYDQ